MALCDSAAKAAVSGLEPRRSKQLGRVLWNPNILEPVALDFQPFAVFALIVLNVRADGHFALGVSFNAVFKK